MPRKSVEQELDDAYERDLWREAFNTLWEGARGDGASLAKSECVVLLSKLPRPRPARWQRYESIARYCHRHEGDGLESAVALTMKRFGVSRSEVFAARKRAKEYLALLRDRREVDD